MEEKYIEKLQTAEEMLRFCYDHQLGKGLQKSKDLRSFELLKKYMDEDEYAFLTFVGIHRFKSMSSHQRNYAYAFTNKRIMMAKMMMLHRTAHEEYPLNKIMNLSFDSDSDIGVMKIMLDRDTINVAMSAENMKHMQDICTEYLPVITGFAKNL